MADIFICMFLSQDVGLNAEMKKKGLSIKKTEYQVILPF